MVARFSDPFEALLNVRRVFDQGQYSDWLGLSTASRGAFPPVNVMQQNDDLVVIAQMPGVKKEDIDISIKRNQLRIAGSRNIDYGDNTGVHPKERAGGSFDRTFSLPLEIEADAAKAEYRNGLLTLYLPRAEKDRPKRVEVA
jgi:HSP20 family protein